MSDENLFEVFEGGDDIFADNEDETSNEQPEGEGQNKTFMIAVAALGGLLLIAIALFAVWLFVLQPRAANRIDEALSSPEPTEEMVEAVVDLDATGTAEAEAAMDEEPTETQEVEPTATPTPVVKTSTPDPEEDETEDADSGNGASSGSDNESSTDEDAATEEPRRTATPTPEPSPTPRPTSTPKPTASDDDPRDTSAGAEAGTDETESLSETGLGEVLLVVAGVVLIGVAFMARKLRSA